VAWAFDRGRRDVEETRADCRAFNTRVNAKETTKRHKGPEKKGNTGTRGAGNRGLRCPEKLEREPRKVWHL